MSKWLQQANSTIDEILSALERELGPTWRVVREPRFDRSLDLREAPDAVLLDEESGQMTLVEFKVAPPDDDLPFATVSETRRLKDWNAMLNPRVVLVSLAEMSPNIERALLAHDIGVIRGRTCGEVMPALRDFIAAGSVAHR